jgi:hypothetical protein
VLSDAENQTYFWGGVEVLIDCFCIMANSIQFGFTKNGIKLNLPKIDLSLFKASFETSVKID